MPLYPTLPPNIAQNAAAQAEQLRVPVPINATTAVNPLQREAYDVTGNAYASADAAHGRAAKYEEEVTAGTAAETRRELERARDEISVGMGAEGEAAMSRGADPSLFRSRALASGKRDLHTLQGKLAGESLRARQGAVDSRTAAAGGKVTAANSRVGAASAAAGEQRMMQLGTMAQRLAENRALVEQAEAQARINEMPYSRLAMLMDSTARNASSYRPPPYPGSSSSSGSYTSTRRPFVSPTSAPGALNIHGRG